MLTESIHAAAFMVSEAPGTRSRDQVTILAGSGAARALTAGMVLGKRIVGSAVAAAFAGNTGNGAMGAITVTGPAKAGVYKLVVIEPGTNLGRFTVEDPDGIEIGVGTVASAFAAGGLAFTLADGATDFVAGDGFDITVTPTGEKWLQYDAAGTLGEQVAAGILRADTTAADGVDNTAAVAYVRDCEVNAAEITWPAGLSAGNKAIATRQLAAVGIILRAGS